MKNIKIPKDVLRNGNWNTTRNFKAFKRINIKQIIFNLEQLRMGCAYMPCYEEIKKIDRLLKIIKEKTSIKNWGN